MLTYGKLWGIIELVTSQFVLCLLVKERSTIKKGLPFPEAEAPLAVWQASFLRGDINEIFLSYMWEAHL